MGKWGIWMEKTKEEGKEREEEKSRLFICAVIFLIFGITIGCGGYVDNNGNIVESSDPEQDSIFYQNKELTQFDIDVYQYFKKHKRDYADMVSFRKDLPGRVVLIIDEDSPITPWDILDFKINGEDGRLELEIVDKNKSGEIRLREGDILIGWVDRFYVRSGDKLPQEYIRWVSFMGRVTGIVKDESKRTLLVYAAPEDMRNVVEGVTLDNVVIDWGKVLEEAVSPQAPVFRVARVSSPLEAKSFEGQKRIFLKFNSIDECISYVRGQDQFNFLPPVYQVYFALPIELEFKLKLTEKNGDKKKEHLLVISPDDIGGGWRQLQSGYDWLNNEMGGRLANIKDRRAVNALRSVSLNEFSINLTLGFKRNIERDYGIKFGRELTFRMGGKFRRTYFHAEVQCVRYAVGFIPPSLTYVAIGKKLSGEKWDLTLPYVDIDLKGQAGVNENGKLEKVSNLLTIAFYKLFRAAQGKIPLLAYLDAKIIVAPGLYIVTNLLSSNLKLNVALKLMGDKTTTYEEYYRVYNTHNIKTAINLLIGKVSRYKDCKQFDDQVLRSSEYLNKISDWGKGSGSCEEVDKVVSQGSGIYFDGKGSLDFEKLFGFGMGVYLLLGKEFYSSFLGKLGGFWVGGNAFLGSGIAVGAGFGGDTSGSITKNGFKFDKMAASAYVRGGFNISLFGGVILFFSLFEEVLLKGYNSWPLLDIFTVAGGAEVTTGVGKKILNPREVKEWVIEKSKEATMEMLTDDELISKVLM